MTLIVAGLVGNPRSGSTTLAAQRILVVATPVYKGSYTGLLTSFLNGRGLGALEKFDSWIAAKAAFLHV